MRYYIKASTAQETHAHLANLQDMAKVGTAESGPTAPMVASQWNGSTCSITTAKPEVSTWLVDCLPIFPPHCGDLLTLTKGDISHDMHTGYIVLNLSLTKTGARLAMDEGISLHDVALAKLISVATADIRRDERIVSLTEAEFRAQFRRLVLFLNLDPTIYTPYSLRRGGATDFYKQTQDFGKCMVVGRCADLKTARIYIQEAHAAVAKLQQPKKEMERMRTLWQPVERLLKL